MLIVLLLVGMGLLWLPGIARPLGRRVAPHEWARLCTVGLAGGAVVVEVALVLYAAPTVLPAAHVPHLSAVCERTLGPLVPGGEVAGWAAAAAAMMLPVLGSIGVRRGLRARRALRAEPWLGEHRQLGEHELVVLPTDRLVAVSVPGDRHGQVVVSQGLVDTLDSQELAAVLRHEVAHLDAGHDRYLLLATTLEHAFMLVPPVRRSTGALRVTLERWADEAAAGRKRESRKVLRRALLGVTAALVVEPSVAAFSAAETVVERLDALDADAPRPSGFLHAALYVPGVGIAVVTGVALLSWVADAQVVLAMAGTCY